MQGRHLNIRLKFKEREIPGVGEFPERLSTVLDSARDRGHSGHDISKHRGG